LLKSLKALSDPKRIPGVDVLRGLAVIAVVLYHFGWLPYGSIGVDLFFVLSGFLVGRPLVRQMMHGGRPTPSTFIVARAFKIWPSYYLFLALGTVIAVALYSHTHPEQIITLEHAPRYIFFFQNYRGTPHWSFDHVWSLCVEEHFYILLPISALIAFRTFGGGARTVIGLAVAGVVTGVLAKIAGHWLGVETYSATHNRIDALSWGLLLAIGHEGGWRGLKAIEQSLFTPIIGIGIIGGAIFADATKVSHLFAKIGFHSVLPLGLVLVVAWARTLRTGPATLRFISYYSYNLYLWHAVFVFAVRDRFGVGVLGLSVYLATSMVLAMAATIFIEEPFLRLRSGFLETRRLAPAPSPANAEEA
jgi:peptidoglycan/LPS O-acetylase OafA/YrhL